MALPSAPADRFREVAAGFTAQTEDVDWDAQTPRDEWRARDLIGHLLSWFGPALEDVGVDVELSADRAQDPGAAWVEFVALVQQTLDDPQKAEALVTRGPIPGQSLERNATGFLIPDVFMHLGPRPVPGAGRGVGRGLRGEEPGWASVTGGAVAGAWAVRRPCRGPCRCEFHDPPDGVRGT